MSQTLMQSDINAMILTMISVLLDTVFSNEMLQIMITDKCHHCEQHDILISKLFNFTYLTKLNILMKQL